MQWLQLGGRFFYGLLFVVNGIAGHFLSHGMLAQYAGSKGVPLPGVMVIVTGIMIVLGGLSVILGYKPKIGLWLLVAFLVPVALIMHNFWAVPADQLVAERAQFLKDMALAGAASMLIVFATDEPWPLSVGGASDTPEMERPGSTPEARRATGTGTGESIGGGPGNPMAS